MASVFDTLNKLYESMKVTDYFAPNELSEINNAIVDFFAKNAKEAKDVELSSLVYEDDYTNKLEYELDFKVPATVHLKNIPCDADDGVLPKDILYSEEVDWSELEKNETLLKILKNIYGKTIETRRFTIIFTTPESEADVQDYEITDIFNEEFFNRYTDCTANVDCDLDICAYTIIDIKRK